MLDFVINGGTIVDADGLLVAPALVDVHAHFDGQVTGDDALEPSMSHGVTTAVIGNCGVGFAPVKAGTEDDITRLMEGVEDIPGAFPQRGYRMELGELSAIPRYALQPLLLDDVGARISHGALRAYVMGERGFANPDAKEKTLRKCPPSIVEYWPGGCGPP